MFTGCKGKTIKAGRNVCWRVRLAAEMPSSLSGPPGAPQSRALLVIAVSVTPVHPPRPRSTWTKLESVQAVRSRSVSKRLGQVTRQQTGTEGRKGWGAPATGRKASSWELPLCGWVLGRKGWTLPASPPLAGFSGLDLSAMWRSDSVFPLVYSNSQTPLCVSWVPRWS